MPITDSIPISFKLSVLVMSLPITPNAPASPTPPTVASEANDATVLVAAFAALLLTAHAAFDTNFPPILPPKYSSSPIVRPDPIPLNYISRRAASSFLSFCQSLSLFQSKLFSSNHSLANSLILDAPSKASIDPDIKPRTPPIPAPIAVPTGLAADPIAPVANAPAPAAVSDIAGFSKPAVAAAV